MGAVNISQITPTKKHAEMLTGIRYSIRYFLARATFFEAPNLYWLPASIMVVLTLRTICLILLSRRFIVASGQRRFALSLHKPINRKRVHETRV